MENTENTRPTVDRPQQLPIVGISAGDPNGIGYEIIIKGLSHPHIFEICRPVVYGNLNVLRQHQKTLGEDWQKVPFQVVRSAKEAQDGKVSIVTLQLRAEVLPTLRLSRPAMTSKQVCWIRSLPLLSTKRISNPNISNSPATRNT